MKNRTVLKFAAVFAVFFQLTAASANTSATALQILESPKGPFLEHVAQSDTQKAKGYEIPAGFLFRAAFRKPEAQVLARTHGFYLGNLFTTNYYELMGEFVYGDADSNHPVRHDLILEKSKAANRRATIMMQNWLLEKHYLRVLPKSNLAQAFAVRSVADIESERGYADYFFDFYLNGLTNEFQFLLAALLVRESPVIDAPSINEARERIADTYTVMAQKWGFNDPKSDRLFALRNLVHNQMTKECIPAIDRFLAETPEYTASGATDLLRVREILVEYYSVRADTVAQYARATTPEIFAPFAQLVSAPKNTPAYSSHLLAASQQLAQLKKMIVENIGFPFQRTKGLHLIATATPFLANQALSLTHPDSDTVRIFLNCAYAEGFLISDNWSYFHQEIDKAQTPAQVKTILNDIVEIGQSTLNQALGASPAAWARVEPRLANYPDSAVKSSSLNALSVFASRIP